MTAFDIEGEGEKWWPEAGGGLEWGTSEAECWAAFEQQPAVESESLRVQGREQCVRGRGSSCMARESLCSSALPALWGATPVGCSGFSSWAGGCSHETRVTAESQRFGFLKRETRQARQYSFPLCSWSSLAAPAEPPQCPPGSGWGRR